MSGDFSPPPPPGQAFPPPPAPPSAPPAPPVVPAAHYGAGYAVAPARPASGLAITSLVCGIAGAALFWALIPMLASIVAVITGHMALGQTKRDSRLGGRGMALAGLILGYAVVAVLLFTIVSTVVGFLLFGAFAIPFLLTA